MTETTEAHQGDASQSVAVSETRMRWRSALRDVGTLSLLAAVLMGVGFVLSANEALGWVTIIVGDWIPTWHAVEFALVGTGAAALLIAACVAPSPPPELGLVYRLSFAAVLTVSVLVSMIVVDLGSSRYSILPEQSDGGCRVVVREYSFLLAGSGHVGIVQPGSITTQWLGKYGADNGLMPFSRGAYALKWNGKTADLDFSGGGPSWATWSRDKPTITCLR